MIGELKHTCEKCVSAEHEEAKESLSEREASLLKDLVDISISAQKVINKANFCIDDMGEVMMLREMTAHVLNTYTKVKGKEDE